jgi:hypothetical protein
MSNYFNEYSHHYILSTGKYVYSISVDNVYDCITSDIYPHEIYFNARETGFVGYILVLMRTCTMMMFDGMWVWDDVLHSQTKHDRGNERAKN